MFERFTERARQVVVLAQEEARGLKHNYIGTEHLLLGLLREQQGIPAHVLEALGVTVERVRRQLLQIVGAGEEITTGQIPFTSRAKKVLELALREALGLGHDYIGTEHLLLGLVRENEGVGARILLDCNASAETVRRAVITRLAGGGPVEDPTTRVQIRSPDWEMTPDPMIDPGWLDGLAVLLAALGAEIRAELGRAPDLGDLLVCMACVPHTPAVQALGTLGVDVDELWALTERARVRAQAEQHALAEQMRQTAQAKELAIEENRLQDAVQLRDQERELRDQARDHPRAQLASLEQLRRRLGLPTPPD